jgi:LysM repeat protein
MLGTVLEYDASRNNSNVSGWRWAVYAVVAVSITISFISARGCFRKKNENRLTSAETQVQIAQTNIVENKNVTVQRQKPATGLSFAAKQASQWAADASGRSARERTLLLRLADAESQGKLSIAADTIETLRSIPSMADLDDKLARRLGDLNIQRLYSGKPVPWVAEVKVRRGQNINLIAREHGTTIAAICKLNKISPDDKLKAGSTLRVLEFVRAAFVVHKKTYYADLSLNGKWFKRYYVSTSKKTKPGAYPITSAPQEGPQSRFAELDIRIAPKDVQELSMFLAPGSSLTISEM